MEQIDETTYRIFDQSGSTLAFVKCIAQRQWRIFDEENNQISDLTFSHPGMWLEQYRADE
jgi:hypothetical protein